MAKHLCSSVTTSPVFVNAEGQTLLQFTFSRVFITCRWSICLQFTASPVFHHILMVNMSTVHCLTCLHHMPMVKPCYSSPSHLSSSHTDDETLLQFTCSPVFITCQWSNFFTVHLLTCLHHMPMVKPCYSSPSHLSSSHTDGQTDLVTVHVLTCLHHMLIVNISTVHRLTCFHHLQWSD